VREGCTVDHPEYTTRTAFEAVRGERGLAWEGDGLWQLGPLEGLRRPSVAIVGTRAATPYGRRLARVFARELGAAGCCIVSGLALGIDTAAHQGALDAGAPTAGVLGSGHTQFFPRRNEALAERMIAAGGAVLSPFPPQQPAEPWHFLARNAIVAALADVVVVIEAPARSGALNTAGWAAPRIPVLAVPGDVDRLHVAGCLALIRDGAILARSAADVLEVLRLPASIAREHPRRDGPPGALLDALAAGECNLDDLVDVTGLAPAQALAELAILELEGVVERRGATRFACSSG
jgi:DNA processing protein